MGLLSITTVTLLGLIACTLVTAKSMRTRRQKREGLSSWSTCNTVALTQTSAGLSNDIRIEDISQDVCLPLPPHTILTTTTLQIHPSSGSCRYKVVGFSGSTCDGRRQNYLSPSSVVTLNRRRPICSFKLKYTPFNPHGSEVTPISVVFTLNNGQSSTWNVVRRGCKTICTPGSDFEPVSVGVYEEPGILTRQNSIAIYSGSECEDESLILPAVKEEGNLAAITRQGTLVKSYMVLRN